MYSNKRSDLVVKHWVFSFSEIYTPYYEGGENMNEWTYKTVDTVAFVGTMAGFCYFIYKMVDKFGKKPAWKEKKGL